MGFAERRKLISEIERIRQSKVICYLTSLRPNLHASMAEDAVRVFFDHLGLLQRRPIEKLDIFLCSNGGSGALPWRLVSLFREYAQTLGVILPYRAYSAATMVALGADEIVMHPFAEMGPIDPTVSNEFNPVDPHTQQRVGISVEDVKAYVAFVKESVGIRHEDELIKAIEVLAEKVHPLALGNVERFVSQSRMIARKILLTHMNPSEQHKIEEIVETLASKLYFHGHPINRQEARTELGLKVAEQLSPELETAIWNLYLGFEEALQNTRWFDPMAQIYNQTGPIVPPPDGQACIVPVGANVELDDTFAIIESDLLTSRYQAKRRFVVAGHGPNFEPIVRNETLSHGWQHKPAG